MENNNQITDGITTGIELRQQRGLEIAAVSKIAKSDNGDWWVPSQSQKMLKYRVRVGKACSCTCQDHELRGCKCKHVYAVEYAIKREQNEDGTETVTESVTVSATKHRPSYPQNWPAYNEAQTNEKRLFQSLLADLCSQIQTPAQTGRGQRRLPLSDAIFCAVFKVYSTFSGRRFISDLCDAQAKGYIEKVPHFNSIFNTLEKEELSEILTYLITKSSLPLRAIEQDFAVDSTGFMTSRFTRWFDQKYGTKMEKADWVKAHVMCGVKTNVVTAVEILDQHAADAPRLPALVDATGKNFFIREVSADKGYCTVDNHAAIEKHGGMPYIPFKSNSTGAQGGAGGVFEKAYHFFAFHRDEFLARYHQRSNVESTFAMIKAKFRDHVRSKTDVAMKNEVLAKILCHNICCLISAIYELGIDPAICTTKENSAQREVA
jgi:transposase